MRIGGLASGMDTESMVKELMKAHRIPLDKITLTSCQSTPSLK